MKQIFHLTVSSVLLLPPCLPTCFCDIIGSALGLPSFSRGVRADCRRSLHRIAMLS
jgi:hypothetical protein